MTVFTHGVILDTPDERDFNAKELLVEAVALPPTFMVDEKPMVYDQDGYPRCAAHCGAGVKTDQEFTETGKRIQFNADLLYEECKKIDGIPDQNGTYLRIVCKVLHEQGISVITSTGCLSAFLKPKAQPVTPSEPYDYRIEAYYRIARDSNVDFIKQIIAQYGSIMLASYWFDTWNSAKAVFSAPGQIDSVHAYRCCGWDETGFVIVNSWGKVLWGIGGISTMPYDMFLRYPIAEGDAWKIVDYVPLKVKMARLNN